MRNIKGRTVWYTIIAFIGIALFAMSAVFNTINGFWSGMGLGLVIMSTLRLFQIAHFSRDKEYAKELTTKYKDERNLFLSNKARSHSFYYSIMAEAAAVIFLRIFEMPEMSTIIGLVMCGQLVIYWASYFLLKLKY